MLSFVKKHQTYMKEAMYRSARVQAGSAVGLTIFNRRLGSSNLSLISSEAWSVTRVYY